MPLQRDTESRFEKNSIAWQVLTLKRPEGRAPHDMTSTVTTCYRSPRRPELTHLTVGTVKPLARESAEVLFAISQVRPPATPPCGGDGAAPDAVSGGGNWCPRR
jgi:hypothetical protein